jgi:hypothetical protein
MNFYFALYQLIETVERLSRDIQHLAGRALRISPRDARANRDLLEQCQSKLGEVRNLLNNKTHISKITLRKTALLFQILELSYRRVMHLASAASNIGPEDESSVKTIWHMLSQAQRHHQALVKTLNDMTGIPVTLVLTGEPIAPVHGFEDISRAEMALQQESLKHLEKAIEVFTEEQGLSDILSGIRKELLEVRKRMKHLNPSAPVEKAEISLAVPLVKS